MWWNGQNIDKPLPGKNGELWHFRVWHGEEDGDNLLRLFFWNDSRSETGLVELRGDQRLHITQIKSRFTKIATDDEYREQFLRPLKFPLERYW